MAWKDRNRRNDVSKTTLKRWIQCAKDVVCLNYEDRNLRISGNETFKFSQLIGIGIKTEIIGRTTDDIEKLRTWLTQANDLVLGYFSYDAKNLLEKLSSKNKDSIEFPYFHFFIPAIAVMVNGDEISCYDHRQPTNISILDSVEKNIGKERKSIPEKEYCSTVNKLKSHIQQGNIYEVNYCVEHGFENSIVDPFRLYEELQENSPAPFSCYVADNGKYLMSSSPERFIAKRGTKLISQPIKGTNRRIKENNAQIEALRNDSKEVAENVMITDLVRNDLSKSAKKGTIKVEELCGVYEFTHVNQMISTVTAELNKGVHPLDAILNAFPMGSMTGAPKIRAMELIDTHEDFARGLYSGTVGYFTPELDFDFNVVIRSILYNEKKKAVTFPTGGAITINSDPKKEYEECILKAEAMRNVLLNHAK